MSCFKETAKSVFAPCVVCIALTGCGSGALPTDENSASHESLALPTTGDVAVDPPSLLAASEATAAATEDIVVEQITPTVSAVTVTEPEVGEVEPAPEALEVEPAKVEPELEVVEAGPEPGVVDSEPEPNANDSAVITETEQPKEPLSAEHLFGLDMPEDFGPFNDYAEQAARSYDGARFEDPLSLASSAELLSNALFGVLSANPETLNPDSKDLDWIGYRLHSLLDLPAVEITVRGNQLPLSGLSDCYFNYQEKNGTMAVDLNISDDDIWRYDLAYDNCFFSDEGAHTGNLMVEYLYPSGGTHQSTYIAYDKLVVSNDKGQFEINGAAKLLDPGACGLDGKTTYYVNIKNLLTGENVLYENFSTTIFGQSDYQCGLQTNNYFAGRIHNSSYGAVNVSTPTALPFGLHTSYDSQIDYTGLAGMVLLESAGDSLEFEMDQLSRGIIYFGTKWLKTATISLAGQSFETGLQFQQLTRDFIRGGFTNLHDTDSDGIIDSWEAMKGLDPTDPNDALSDEDGDWVSALLEYQFLGDPLINYTGKVVDRQVRIGLSHGTNLTQDKIRIHIDEALPIHISADDSVFTVTVAPSVTGQWETLDEGCSLVSDNMLVECEVEAYSDVFFTLYFVPDQDGKVDFTVSTDVPQNDINPSNNSITWGVEFERPDVNLSLDFLGDVIAESNQELTISGQVIRSVGDSASPVSLSLTHSPEITIIGAVPNTNNYQNVCEITESESRVNCSSTIPSNEEAITVDLNYIVSAPGNYEINWQLLPVEFETEFSDNTSTTSVVIQNGVGELQQLIDDALPGDTVTFPAGEYVGELSLNKMQLVLEGAAGDEPTILTTNNKYHYGISDIGNNTIIRNMHFKVNGPPILFDQGDFLTVADNTFEPADESAGDFSRVLVDSWYGDRRDASLRFINNSVKNLGTQGKLRCGSVLSITGWREIFIERNVFANNECGGYLFSGENAAMNINYEESIHINNNTFVNVPKLFGPVIHTPVSPDWNLDINVANNILFNVELIFSDSTLDMFIDRPVFLNTSSNLLFNSERDKIVTDRMLIDAKAAQVSPDIVGDPLFADELSDGFELSAGSGAIDAGATVPLGDMGVVYSGEVEPLDGDLDGVAAPDVGALEYNPVP